MAPVQTPLQNKEKERPLKPGQRRSELICRVKFNNNLPDFPFDPKFITYPFDSNRFVEYKPTSLEKNHKHDLLTEHDLGVNIDLIDPDLYAIPAEYQITGNATLPIEDDKLIEEETGHACVKDLQRSRQHNKVVPWLKKTEYISTEFNRFGASSEKTETKVGYNVKKLLKEENVYMDKESQIEAINKTFEDAKKPITEHHSKKGVTPVEILDVFPDFERWKYPFAQVQFDADPAPLTKYDEMSQAMIRGVMDESGEQFVAYFLPTKETLEKRSRDKEQGVEYVDEEEYEYDMAREYNWNVKSKSSKGYEENYFFVFSDKAVYYNELETRVRLNKRRAKTESSSTNSKLVVRHRPLSDQEFKTQELRLRMLQPPLDEEEEEVENMDTRSDGDRSEQGGDVEREEEEDEKDEKSAAKSDSKSSSSSSGSSSSDSSDDSDSEDDTQKKKATRDIFGGSDSESG